MTRFVQSMTEFWHVIIDVILILMDTVKFVIQLVFVMWLTDGDRERDREGERKENTERRREKHTDLDNHLSEIMTVFWDVIMHVIMVIYVWSHNSIIIVSSKLSYDLVNTGHFDCLTINTSREKDTEKERDWDRLTISRSHDWIFRCHFMCHNGD